MDSFTPNLEGKALLITGASSGIGQQCAVVASRLGANLLLLTRSQERIRETISLLPGGAHYAIHEVDFSYPAQVEESLPAALEEFGALDGVIHCAGISVTRPLSSITEKQARELIDVNLLSAYLLVKTTTRKRFFADTGGSIVLVSSVMGTLGARGKSVYSLTKGGLNGTARSLAVELASRQIRVNTVSPGVVTTPLSSQAAYQLDPQWAGAVEAAHPLGVGRPLDVANACVFLVSDLSRWVTGIDLVVDGGYSAL
jgi:NAD(P)-dependent dehydrogenase (short-subunit alcohol dehydrogenase family)